MQERRSKWLGKPHQRDPAAADRRLFVLRLVAIFFAGVVVFRLFTLQIVDAGFYSGLASDQYDFYQKLFPRRGDVLVHDLKDGQLYPLATNIDLGFVFANPRGVKDPHDEAETLGQILGMSDADVLALSDKLSNQQSSYVPIQRKVPQETLTLIDAADLPGITYRREPTRLYPEAGLGGNVIGFLGSNSDGSLSGKYGIEGFMDEELAGKVGFQQSEVDPSGHLLDVGDNSYQPAVDGSNVVLTIDRNIQYEACQSLEAAVTQHQADGGSVVILNPQTGAVMAMCGAPDFDPNVYGQVKDPSAYNNPSIFYAYEPGSIFKAVTMAAAIDAGAITPTTTYTDTGSVTIEDRTIKNAESTPFGLQTMTFALDQSLNTGAIFAMQQIGRDLFKKYVQDFGFGSPTGIQLDKEVAGDISALSKQSNVYPATASFGQGITTTTLQMADAYAAMANGGKLMQPYVVDEIDHPDGRVDKTKPVTIRQVISEKSAGLISAMLVSVVEDGLGKKAAVPGYYIAGKTGTAQVAGTNGSYQDNITIGSFAGYGPVGNPKFVMVVRIDHPRDVQWAESSAAPLFGQIAKYLLTYLEVPPQR